MARHQPKDARREPHERARDVEEPGAPSGRKSQESQESQESRKSQARERSAPGTASARKGHRLPGGTAQDEALEGVRAHGEDAEQGRGTERTRDDAHGKRTQP